MSATPRPIVFSSRMQWAVMVACTLGCALLCEVGIAIGHRRGPTAPWVESNPEQALAFGLAIGFLMGAASLLLLLPLAILVAKSPHWVWLPILVLWLTDQSTTLSQAKTRLLEKLAPENQPIWQTVTWLVVLGATMLMLHIWQNNGRKTATRIVA